MSHSAGETSALQTFQRMQTLHSKDLFWLLLSVSSTMLAQDICNLETQQEKTDDDDNDKDTTY